MVASGADPKDARRRLLSLTGEGTEEAERVEALSIAWTAFYEELMADAGVDLVGGLKRIEDACARRSLLTRRREALARRGFAVTPVGADSRN